MAYMKIAKTMKRKRPLSFQNTLKNYLKTSGSEIKQNKDFTKKPKMKKGKVILSLDLKSFEYKTPERVKYASLAQAKEIEDLRKRIKFLYHSKDEAGEFYREMFSDIFSYVSHRIPEISDETYRIDQAMKAGFGWELGPFEIWDAIGAQAAYETAIELGRDIAPWVKEMLGQGTSSFIRLKPML